MSTLVSPEMLGGGTPSLAQTLGGAVGGGLHSGLEMLIQKKIQDQQAAVLGIPPGLSPALQKEYFKQASQKQKMQQTLDLLGGTLAEDIETPSVGTKGPLGEREIAQITLENAPLGKVLQNQRESYIKRESARVEPIFKRADERAESLVPKESALATMKMAVKEGNLGAFSWNNIAERTGIEALRDPKGALFKSASKEFFLGSLKRAGTRPNMWIEKQIQKMLPQIGRSKEANLVVSEALQTEINLENEHQNILNRLKDEDEAKLGYVKGDIGHRARKELKGFAEKEQVDLQRRMEEILGKKSKEKKETILMRDPDGSLRRVSKADAKKAKAGGYTLE